jgi:hypothetical protein
MGRKQIRTGKHLLYCITGLIFLSLNGCALLETIKGPAPVVISPAEKEKIRQKEALAAEEKRKEETARAHLLKGRKLFAQGDWEGSLLENQRIITGFQGKSPMEEALFMTGLIHLHPDNPHKDISKGLEAMRRMVKEQPNSYFSQQAKAWIVLLMIQEKTGKENEKLTKDLERLWREHEKMSKMLEEYKKVDIEIEGKKR